jgi:hypothetical protein
METVGILLGIIAIGLIFWFRRNQQKTNELVNTYFDNCETGMNAMMDNFNKYQIETDRKIAELEKQLEIKSKSQDKKMEKHLKELPFIIGKVVGQIEFSQDMINRKM